jgi:hypothetical protein
MQPTVHLVPCCLVLARLLIVLPSKMLVLHPKVHVRESRDVATMESSMPCAPSGRFTHGCGLGSTVAGLGSTG